MNRIRLTLLCLVVVAASCRKDHTPLGPGTGNNFTPIPVPTPVNTSLVVYSTDNNTNQTPLSIQANGANFSLLPGSVNSRFYSTPLTTDKYQAVLTGSFSDYWNSHMIVNSKVFTTLEAEKNYVDMKFLPVAEIFSFFTPFSGQSFDLSAGAQITFPADVFGKRPGQIDVWWGYSAPSTPDYILTAPSYPMADENQKRYYLNSFGTFFFACFAPYYATDFDTATNVQLKYPIPTNLLGQAPDSIPVWKINGNHLWERNGYAVKKNNTYERRVEHVGFYNFAIPSDGVYLTLHIRNTNGLALANTRLKVKSGNDEIADARTNSNGDALVFVPVGKDMYLNIYNEIFSPSLLDSNTQHLGVFNAAAEKTFTIAPAQTLMEVDGNAFNCDGSVFGNGTALLTLQQGWDTYTAPIKNGHFKMATWNEGSMPATMEILDNNGVSQVKYNSLNFGGALGGPATTKPYVMNFYTCKTAAKVYCNYTVDTTSYALQGDGGPGSSFVLSGDTLSIKLGGKGISTGLWFDNYGLGHLSGYSLFNINGVPYTMDGGNSSIYIATAGIDTGDYVEGHFCINYKDAGNVTHNTSGNFRVFRK
jgi:hypothetical protein